MAVPSVHTYFQFPFSTETLFTPFEMVIAKPPVVALRMIYIFAAPGMVTVLIAVKDPDTRMNMLRASSTEPFAVVSVWFASESTTEDAPASASSIILMTWLFLVPQVVLFSPDA